MNTFIIAVAEATVSVVTLYQLVQSIGRFAMQAYPCEHAALGEEPTIHLLPAYAIVLHNWLIWDPEGTPGRKAPVCGIKSYRRLLKRFARTT